tara:strand:- start:338 stop:511 length:174 start_codon:yes stop_codon:yes gene_type:complete
MNYNHSSEPSEQIETYSINFEKLIPYSKLPIKTLSSIQEERINLIYIKPNIKNKFLA